MVVVSEARCHEAPQGTPHGSRAKCGVFEEKLKKKMSVFGASFFLIFWGGGMAEQPRLLAELGGQSVDKNSGTL